MKILLSMLLLCLFVAEKSFGQYCGTKEPVNNRLHQNINYQRSYCYGSSTVVVTIQPTIFRRTNGTGGISIEEMVWSFDNLKEHFIQANISFVISPVRIISDDVLFNTIYEDRNDNNDFDDPDLVLQNFMTTDAVDVFFVQNMVGVSGGASLPQHKNGLGNERDWIVIDNDYIMRKALMPHEMGHYLGLLHTHQSTSSLHDGTPNSFDPATIEFVNKHQCYQRGDNICDTEADPGLSPASVDANCNYTGTFVDLLGMPYTPDPTNIMSYSRAECRSSFSSTQIMKMRCHLSSSAFMYGRNYVVGDNRPCTSTTWVYLNDNDNYLGCNEDIEWHAVIKNNTTIGARDDLKIHSEMGSTADVIAQAGQRIQLKPGFKVSLGAKFKTQMQSCSIVPCSNGTVPANNSNILVGHQQADVTHSEEVTTNVNKVHTTINELKCYPNPANQVLNVVFGIEQAGSVFLKLVDLQGRTVIELEEKTLPSGVQEYELNTTELMNGVYFLTVQKEDEIQTEKIVIVH